MVLKLCQKSDYDWSPLKKGQALFYRALNKDIHLLAWGEAFFFGVKRVDDLHHTGVNALCG